MKIDLQLNQKTPIDWLPKEQKILSFSAANAVRKREISQRSFVALSRADLSTINATPAKGSALRAPPNTSFAEQRSALFNRSVDLSPPRSLRASVGVGAVLAPRAAPSLLNALAETAAAPDLAVFVDARAKLRRKMFKMRIFFFLVFGFLQFLLFRFLSNLSFVGIAAPNAFRCVKYAFFVGFALVVALHAKLATNAFQFDRRELAKSVFRGDSAIIACVFLSFYLHHFALSQLEAMLAAKASLGERVLLFIARCLAELRVSAAFWLRFERRRLARVLEIRARDLLAALGAELRAALAMTAATAAVGALLLKGGESAALGFEAFGAAQLVAAAPLLRIWLLFAVHCAGFEAFLDLFGVVARFGLRSYFGAGRGAQALLELLSLVESDGGVGLFEQAKCERDCLRFLNDNLLALYEFNFLLDGGAAAVQRAKANWRLLLACVAKSVRALQESFQPNCERDYEAQRDFLDYLFNPRKSFVHSSVERRKYLRTHAQLLNLGLKLDVLKQLFALVSNSAVLTLELEELRPLLNGAERLARDLPEFLNGARESFWTPKLRAKYAYLAALLEDFLEKAYPILFDTQFKPQIALR